MTATFPFISTYDSILPPKSLIDQVTQRLRGVDPALVAADKRGDFLSNGARALVASPESAPFQSLEIARINPVLSASWGIGAVTQARLAGDPWIESVAAVSLGVALISWGQYRSARTVLRPAAAWLSANLPQDKTLILARWHLILAERFQARVPASGQQLLELAERMMEQGQERAAMRCLVDAAEESMHRGDSAKLQEHNDTALDYFSRRDSDAELGWATLNKSVCCLTISGEFDQGLAYLDQAETLFAEKEVSCGLARVWLLRAKVHCLRREFEDAARWIASAHTLAIQLRHDKINCLSLLAQAELCEEQGDFTGALGHIRRLAGLASRLGLGALLSQSRLMRGGVYYHQGRYDPAQRAFERARRAFERAGYPIAAAAARMKLGALLRRQGHFAQALELLVGARTAFDWGQAFEHRIDVRFELGLTYASLSHYQLAIAQFRECIALLEAAALFPRLVKPLINLAHILAACGEIAQAQAQLARATMLADTGIDSASIQQLQGDLAFKSGESSQARDWYRRSMEQFRQLTQVTAAQEALLKIGSAYAAMKRPELGQQTLEELRVDELPASLRWGYYTVSARLAETRHAPRQALDDLTHALREMRQVRHALLEADLIEHFALANQRAFSDALNLAIDLRDFYRALEVIELFGGRHPHHSASLWDEPMSRLDLDRLRAMFDELWGNAWTIIRFAWLGQAPNRTLLVFALTSTRLECYPVQLSSEQNMMLKMCSEEHELFRQRAYLHLDGATGRELNGLRSRRLLADALIPNSVRDNLRPDCPLIIIPAGELNGVAFGALLDDDTPLVCRAQISYASSLGALMHSLETDQHALMGKGLILAQPEFSQPGYPALPLIRRETDALLSIKPGAANALSDDQLTRAALMESGVSGAFARFDWLHLATHAYADPETGEHIGLIFGEDVVTIEDIRSWRLSAALVTVAACQTALGHWGYADDLAGIAQAFLAAGARTVVASLWSVADEQACQLVTALYRKVFEGLTPSTALAQIQREAHRAGTSPYYWATFGVYGRP